MSRFPHNTLDVRDPLAEAGALVKRMRREVTSGCLTPDRAQLMLDRTLAAIAQAEREAGTTDLSFRPSQIPEGARVRFVTRTLAVIEGGKGLAS